MLSRCVSRTQSGFSLIELAVVFVIIGVVAGLALPTLGSMIGRSKEHTALSEQKSLAREVVALAALSGDFEAALLAAVGDISAAAPGVWAEQQWAVLREPGTTGDVAVGVIRYALTGSSIGWVARYDNDLIACAAAMLTASCWSTPHDTSAATPLAVTAGW